MVSKNLLSIFHAIALVGLAVVIGCAGSKTDKKDVLIERGRVSNRGNSPFSLVMFETTDGRTFVLQSSQVVDELSRLEGMDVEISGVVRPDLEGETPMFAVDWYNLLPLPGGEIPIVGRIEKHADGMEQYVWLIDDKEVPWIIEGPFTDVLAGFVGSKVWVAGDVQPNVVTSRGETWKTILVSEYGIIR